MAKTAELISVQYLRAVAATMVVGVHLLPQLERQGYDGPWPHWLIGGVDLFFVISGFVMWLTTCGRQQTPLEFYQRRIRRIVPLYWLLTAFMAMIVLFAPRLVQSARFDPWHILASFFFIPSPNPATGLIEPLLIPGWTLNYEMFFYLLFGIALLIPEQRRLIAFSVLLCAIVSLQILKPAPDTILSFYTSSIILEFMLGMWIGARFKYWRESPAVIPASILLVCGCVAIAILPTFWPTAPRLVIFGLPAAGIVIAGLQLEKAGIVPRWQPLLRLGDASYSLYLSHALVLSAVNQIWLRLLPSGGDTLALFAFSLIAVLISFAVALVLYRFVEHPLAVNWKLGRKASETPPPATGQDHAR